MSNTVPTTHADLSAETVGEDGASSESLTDVRGKMKQYWSQYDASPESMMLCSAASDKLAEDDRAQVLQISPTLFNKRVLELGCGIGRFTTELASRAKHVTAIDFMENYISKNIEANGHLSNVSFMTADVTELELPNNSYDVIFTNWLLMYLSDEEVEKVAIKMLRWLPDGGYLFIRESCYHASGNVKRVTNPTYYRTPLEYFRILKNCIYRTTTGHEYSFVCQRALSISAYIKHYGNPFQLGFILKKMSHSSDSYDSFQDFLDGQQYTEQGIRRYEFIFGKTYLSTGGFKTTESYTKLLNLNANSRVLDVGCGIGGSAFYMARQYGCQVHGVDLSSNMISMAVKYQSEMEDTVCKLVSFEMSDITKQNFEPNSFDVIYSRDTILHIGDKEALFEKFFNWVRPGGVILITDYCRGDKEEHSEAFLKYVHQRGYHLLTVEEYGRLLEKVGFGNVEAKNQTNQFIDILSTECKQFNEKKVEFLKQFNESDFTYIVDGWQAKIERCSMGDQAWGFFTAKKPV